MIKIEGEDHRYVSPEEADIASRKVHTETASQYKSESSHYEDVSRRTQYPPVIPEDELPF